MKLIILFGPPAVGKRTVGLELAKLTGLKLIHNHTTIELVLNFFDWNSPQFKLSNEFRYRVNQVSLVLQIQGRMNQEYRLKFKVRQPEMALRV